MTPNKLVSELMAFEENIKLVSYLFSQNFQAFISHGRLKDHDKERDKLFKNLQEKAEDLNKCFLIVKEYQELKTIDVIDDYSKIMIPIIKNYLPAQNEYLKITTYQLIPFF